MTTLILSKDEKLLNSFDEESSIENNFVKFNESESLLDLLSSIYKVQPSILILDDDFLKPNSVDLIKYVKQVNNKIAIIFFTSDTSIELGRKVTPLGIQFYAIKPLSEEEIKESLNSIIKLQLKKQLN